MSSSTTIQALSKRDLHNEDDNLDDFQSLLITLPMESTKYSFIGMFLARVLNLKDESLMMDFNTTFKPPANKRPVEVLPHIAVPFDLWLNQDVTIQHVKLKNAVLKEVNSMLQSYAEMLKTKKLFLLDEHTLLSLEKRINDYRLLDFVKQELELRFDSLREDDEYEHEDVGTMASLKRSTVLELIMLQRPVSTASSINRISTFSRDLMVGKRKFSFLGQHHSPTLPVVDDARRASLLPTTPVQTLPVLQQLPQFGMTKDGLPHSFLSKSKFYNKIKKRRELYSLIASTPTSISSGASNPSRRKSSTYDPHDSSGNNFKSVIQVTHLQRIENQRDKQEYYYQAKLLDLKTHFFLGYIGRSGSRANLLRIMEFIKNYVFKFIVVDIAHMIIDYGHRKAGN